MQDYLYFPLVSKKERRKKNKISDKKEANESRRFLCQKIENKFIK